MLGTTDAVNVHVFIWHVRDQCPHVYKQPLNLMVGITNVVEKVKRNKAAITQNPSRLTLQHNTEPDPKPETRIS